MRLFCFVAAMLLCGAAFTQKIAIVPQPASLQVKPGNFALSKSTALVVTNDADRNAADFLNDYLQRFYGFELAVTQQATNNSIRLFTRQHIQAPDNDGYSFTSTAADINIEGETTAGTFYGVQTLIQVLPLPATLSDKSRLQIPLLTITDKPRFDYRGMHLDVARHFFPVDFVKKYIDYLALHKFNYFHWHLTDDQGWRIEIKKHPKLTQTGAYREGTIIGRYPGTGNDSLRYGGFYTQQQIKEVVQYAADRFITVVPEIEMPGHALAALETYPHLGCPGTGPYKVAQTWGVFDDVFCAGNDSTFLFLQDVIDAVVQLFPSPYIHIGGDECPKMNWESCPRCQARIKAEGLKDEHELQSYFIQRMEKYVNGKGRTIIGWDEILEGGLAPNAIVMSWRGEAGGIAAAKEGHKVIMTPGSHVYFDHTQSANEDSVTIGGYTPVEKTYSYEPIPNELNATQAKYIMGAQANLWTEYIKHPAKVEYMVFPRMSALSEVLWTPKAQRSWAAFEPRMLHQMERYKLWGAHYSNAYFDITTTVAPAPSGNGLQVTLGTKDKEGKLTYGIAGKHFARNYTGPFLVTEATDLTAMLNRNGQLVDSVSMKLHFNKATGKKITLSQPPTKNYPGDGAFTLVDGIINERGMARTKEVIGYQGGVVEAVIDLGTATAVAEVKVHALASGGSWVHPPQEVVVSTSADGKTYTTFGTAREFAGINKTNGALTVHAQPVQARFIKVEMKALDKIPSGLPGAGNKAWMFVHEVEVR